MTMSMSNMTFCEVRPPTEKNPVHLFLPNLLFLWSSLYALDRRRSSVERRHGNPWIDKNSTGGRGFLHLTNWTPFKETKAFDSLSLLCTTTMNINHGPQTTSFLTFFPWSLSSASSSSSSSSSLSACVNDGHGPKGGNGGKIPDSCLKEGNVGKN